MIVLVVIRFKVGVVVLEEMLESTAERRLPSIEYVAEVVGRTVDNKVKNLLRLVITEISRLESYLVVGRSYVLIAFSRKSLGDNSDKLCILNGLGYCGCSMLAANTGKIFLLTFIPLGKRKNSVFVIKVTEGVVNE